MRDNSPFRRFPASGMGAPAWIDLNRMQRSEFGLEGHILIAAQLAEFRSLVFALTCTPANQARPTVEDWVLDSYRLHEPVELPPGPRDWKDQLQGPLGTVLWPQSNPYDPSRTGPA
jgi:hypothetical protein